MLIELQILGSVALAMLLGAVVGIEREIADKPAGFRTHMLVSGAAALLIGVSGAIVDALDVNSSLIQADPLRIIEAIVAGVSFLGAGTIFRRKEAAQMQGLTTAASLLFVAGIGVCVASTRYLLAIGATLLALFVLTVVKRAERYLVEHFGSDEATAD